MNRDFVTKLLTRLRGSFWGALRLNSFVYDACTRNGVKWPDIPVRPVELYGQCGEDLIVVSLLEGKALSEGVDLKQKHYLEIGGNHPFATSATFLLHERLGMNGTIVEANAKLIADLKKGRPDDTIVHAAVHYEDVKSVMLSVSKLSEISSLDRNFVMKWAGGAVGEAAYVEVAALRLNEVVRVYLNNESPTFLSIDVEGLDLKLLQDFDFNLYRPWFVQCEPSDTFIPGNTKSIIEYMRSVNYSLIAKTPVNLIFINSSN